MKKILVIGTYILDIVIRDQEYNIPDLDNLEIIDTCEITIGGNACNVSYNLSCLGNLVDSYGRVANDFAGQYIIRNLVEKKIGIEYVEIVNNGKTGISIILVDEGGEKRIQQFWGENKESSFSRNIDFSQYSIVIITGLGLLPLIECELENIIWKIKQNNIIIVADNSSNVLPLVDIVNNNKMKGIDYFIPNEREVLELTGCKSVEQSIDYLLEKGILNIIVKQGKEGCYYGNKKFKIHVPAYNVNVIDTTGAGDAFVAGFVHALSKGKNVDYCLRFGNAVGAECVKKIGATNDKLNKERIINNYEL